MLAVLDALKGFDGTESLPDMRGCLLVAGRRTRRASLPHKSSRAAADARLQVIDGAGPLVNTESARELADLTHSFLDEPDA